MSCSNKIAVLFSGGLDSSILLAHLLREGRHAQVQPLYVDCGLVWQTEELAAARRFLRAIESDRLGRLVVLQMPLADVYADHWSLTGHDVPRADDPDEDVYLPGRNPLLMVKAHVWCHLHGFSELALGALKSNPFSDATEAFFRAFNGAMDQALGTKLRISRPLAAFDKRQVMALGQQLPLELTFSCLLPQGGEHCGVCNKCAERQQAFRIAGLKDPTLYARTPRRLAI